MKLEVDSKDMSESDIRLRVRNSNVYNENAFCQPLICAIAVSRYYVFCIAHFKFMHFYFTFAL